jgi:hypothetical protein
VGGRYYGLRYNAHDPLCTLLTAAVQGPGRGKSIIAIVRCGASPAEWRERHGERLLVLLNSVVPLGPR